MEMKENLRAVLESRGLELCKGVCCLDVGGDGSKARLDRPRLSGRHYTQAPSGYS